jgi:hypothetical protein
MPIAACVFQAKITQSLYKKFKALKNSGEGTLYLTPTELLFIKALFPDTLTSDEPLRATDETFLWEVLEKSLLAHPGGVVVLLTSEDPTSKSIKTSYEIFPLELSVETLTNLNSLRGAPIDKSMMN